MRMRKGCREGKRSIVDWDTSWYLLYAQGISFPVCLPRTLSHELQYTEERGGAHWQASQGVHLFEMP